MAKRTDKIDSKTYQQNNSIYFTGITQVLQEDQR